MTGSTRIDTRAAEALADAAACAAQATRREDVAAVALARGDFLAASVAWADAAIAWDRAADAAGSVARDKRSHRVMAPVVNLYRDRAGACGRRRDIATDFSLSAAGGAS